MASLFDGARLDLTCPTCAKKFSETVARLKRETEARCPGCQGRILLDSRELREAFKAIDKDLDDIRRLLR